MIIQTKKISAVKLKTLNWLRMSHLKITMLHYFSTISILLCNKNTAMPMTLRVALKYVLRNIFIFPIFLTVQKISRSLEEVRHLQCRKLGNLKFHAHQFLITALLTSL